MPRTPTAPSQNHSKARARRLNPPDPPPDQTEPEFVFGYGSLVGHAGARGARPARLDGYRRAWTVAMDNSTDIPGYKFYVDPVTKQRPRVFVAFVDLTPDPDASTGGVLIPVDASTLRALDQRERNYVRRDVTDRIGSEHRTWAYFGTRDARERNARGRAEGTAVVARAYLDQLTPGPPPDLPVVDLERVDLPPC